MKKRVLALLMAVCLMMSSAVITQVSADASTIKGYFDEIGVPTTQSCDLTANVQVRKSTNTTYIEGPINITKYASAAFPKFDFRTTLDMSPVRTVFTEYMDKARLLLSSKPDLNLELDGTKVFGKFDIVITVPKNFKFDQTYITTVGTMYGFNEGAKDAFVDTARVYNDSNTNANILTITVAVKDGITASVLEDTFESYLGDIIFECKNTQPSKKGVYKIYVSATGHVSIGGTAIDTNQIATINFNFNKPASESELCAIVSIAEITNPTPPPFNPTPDEPDKESVTITFSSEGDTSLVPPVKGLGSATTNLSTTMVPAREGYVFDGFYADENFTKALTGVLTVKVDTIVYIKWVKDEVPEELKSDDHKAYVYGYPDGTVQPDGNITREEVAAMLYRLMNDEAKAEIAKKEPITFSDVASDRWSYNEISEMSKGGFIKGYPDGTFGPSGKITRAEFTAILARFSNETVTEGNKYSDIIGHWAESYILTADSNKWIEGYNDGTFKPDQYITRAEAMQMLNKVLVRYVNEEGLAADAKIFEDCQKGHAFFWDVVEATNSHEFTRAADGYHEIWSK